MNFSEIWIRRPVMTILVMLALFLFGWLSYRQLPINNLPNVDFPTISVTAKLPGASPETMAATVAMPLEKQFSSIPGVDSMTSTSTLGISTVNIQFALERSIDAAALDVNAAISAAMGVLPRNMPNPPTFKKVNPADMPILLFAITSDSLPVTAMNDFADNVLVANISSIFGVAEVSIIAPQKRAVRVQLNPDVLARRGIGINEVADALQSGNVNMPGGSLNGPSVSYTIDSNGQLMEAKDFESLVITYRDGAPVRVGDVGRAIEGVETDRVVSWYLHQGVQKRTIVLGVNKQPGSNTVQVANAVKAMLPRLRSAMPPAMKMDLFYDQSLYIRESIDDVQFTMILTLCLVVMVVFLFIRAWKPTIIPSLVVPLSIIATFPVMGFMGYTLNNLSLMALTLSIGFVVDDAIVVLENIIRRMELGEGAMEASLKGSREIGFTIVSMTVSLAVVFIPILFMGGILGRLFREFAVCITMAILFSGFLSLTMTPMLSSRMLKNFGQHQPGALSRLAGRCLDGMVRLYAWTLRRFLRWKWGVLAGTVVITFLMVRLYDKIPKGFVPNEDQGFFRIFTQIDDKCSFDDMVRHQEAVNRILASDPDTRDARIVSLAGFGGIDNKGIAFLGLGRRQDRTASVDQLINRLRPGLNAIPGLSASLVNPPVINIGSRVSTAQWQFTLQSTDLDDLYQYTPLLEEKMRALPALIDVKSDLQLKKPHLNLTLDRDRASSLGITLKQAQDAFYTSYGDRQISTIYTDTSFYYVIQELLPAFKVSPPAMDRLYLKSPQGALVPLSAIATKTVDASPLSVGHAGQIPAATIFFNLKPGASIGDATGAVEQLAHQTLPGTISTSFQGTAKAFQSSLAGLGFLLLVTVLIIYMVLGILYESFIHPLTILTALPLAGFGALAALWLLNMELDLYAFVGIIMLVGIVKKNGIMMVDFALEAERTKGLTAEESIFQACQDRFRPIMMTTLAALFGAVPIAIGMGAGGEARQPLGVAVVGGLLFSQLLTLYVTPVFYIFMDRLNARLSGHGRKPAS